MAARFRPPAPGDPEPDPRRLAIVSVWAAALGFGGAIVAVHLLINLFRSDGGWYRPTIMAIGAIGLLATIGAFGSMHHRRLPWIMLGLGTAALMAAFTVTAAA